MMAGKCVVINKRSWNNQRALQHFQYKPFFSQRLLSIFSLAPCQLHQKNIELDLLRFNVPAH